ncbi:MAG: serine/threonine-protein phosphatase [Silicimonas sp.]|nr:serine/threonine-protein phosphatase [Silicimonas sp.]
MNQRSAFTLGRRAPAAGTEPRFEIGTAIHKGARDYQQDALVTNFLPGEDHGIAILADGMGGHLGGDVASAISVGVAFAEIKSKLKPRGQSPSEISDLLSSAAHRANEAVAKQIIETPAMRDMGSTLVGCVALGNSFHWISIGDSPLYLYRSGVLKRLNADHSMGPKIDVMAATGLIDQDLATDHPQRNQLLSAIAGDEIPYIDCPSEAFTFKAGDIVILASDGLQTLSDDEIRSIVHRKRKRGADEITQNLLNEVLDAESEGQDNVSIVGLKVLSDAPMEDTTEDRVEVFDAFQELSLGGTGPALEKASDLLDEALRL